MGYIESFHQVSEVVPSESPLEGGGDALVVPLEAKESLLHIVQGEEVVGGENLTLNDREVDFDLVEPTCVDRAVHGHDVGEGRLKALDRGLSAMRGAVVQDPEHAAGIPVRGFGHDLGDEAIERFDARGFFATSKDLGTMDIKGSQVGPGTPTRVLVFDASGLCRPWGQRWVFADTGLDTGFLIGREHKLFSLQRFALPLFGVEVEDAPGLGRKLRIAREDPCAVPPGADGVFMEPPPHCLVADGCDDARALCLAHDVCRAQA